MRFKQLLIERGRNFFSTVLAASILTIVYVVGDYLTSKLSLPLSPALTGLFLLLTLLFCLPQFARWMIQSSQMILRHMLLFFIPAILMVATFLPILRESALSLFFAIVVSTLLSLGVSGYFAQKVIRK